MRTPKKPLKQDNPEFSKLQLGACHLEITLKFLLQCIFRRGDIQPQKNRISTLSLGDFVAVCLTSLC